MSDGLSTQRPLAAVMEPDSPEVVLPLAGWHPEVDRPRLKIEVRIVVPAEEAEP